VQGTLASIARASGFSSVVTEDRGLLPRVGTEHAIPDLTFRDDHLLTIWATDLVVADPQGRGTGVAGAAAAEKEALKARHYAPFLQQTSGVSFLGLGIETLGSFGPGMRRFLDLCTESAGRRLSDSGDDGFGQQRARHLFTQQIGVALQRAQAQAIRRRVRDHLSPADIEQLVADATLQSQVLGRRTDGALAVADLVSVPSPAWGI
jgi:hypothetical protein